MSVYTHTYCTRCRDTGPVLDYGKGEPSGEHFQAELQRQWLRKHMECLHRPDNCIIVHTRHTTVMRHVTIHILSNGEGRLDCGGHSRDETIAILRQAIEMLEVAPPEESTRYTYPTGEEG